MAKVFIGSVIMANVTEPPRNMIVKRRFSILKLS